MKKNKVIKLIASLFIVSFVLSACGKTNADSTEIESNTSESITVESMESNKETNSGGSITTMIQTEPDSFNPFKAAAADTWSLLYNIYDGLVVLDEDGSMNPDLASSYEISEDNLTYSFDIINTAVFSNGVPVTIDDVVYSYKKYAENTADFANIDTVSSEGNKLIIELKTADAGFLTICNKGVVPADESLDLNKNPIGSGPYKVTSYITGSEVVFEKNEYYNTNENRKPNIDKVVVKVNVSDPSIVLNQLLAGDMDLGNIDPSHIPTLQSKNFKISSEPTNTVCILSMNMKEKPFDNLLVRKAINYAIDKDSIVKNVMDGQGTTLLSHMSPAMKAFYTEDLKNTYNYDTEQAKKLLKEAGLENGFEFTIKVPSSYQRHVDTALLIKDMLSKINVTANIEKIEWATWLEDVYTNRNYEASIIGHAGIVDPGKVLNIYVSDYPKNYFNYENEEYDKVIQAGAQTTDEAKRFEYYQEAQQMLIDDAVCVYTMDPNSIKASKESIGGVKSFPIYFLDMASLYYEK